MIPALAKSTARAVLGVGSSKASRHLWEIVMGMIARTFVVVFLPIAFVVALDDSCFAKWLKNFCELLRETFKTTGMLMGNHEHYDSILSLLAVSIEDDDEQK